MKPRPNLRRAFTLIELMVALSAGMIVASAAYALAKSSLDVFQQEARMQATQYGSTLGLSRLANDLRRAGYMVTPDITNDPLRCGPVPTDVGADMLRALRIVPGTEAGYENDLAGDPTHAHDTRLFQATNGRRPDRVTIAGNFMSGELFQVASVEANVVHLQDSSPAVARVAAQAQQGGPSVCATFRPGGRNQYARIVDSVGLERYVIVTGCVETLSTTGSYPTYTGVTLNYANTAGWTAPPCVPPVLINATINPVNVVDYSIVNVRGATARTDWGMDDSYGAMLGSLDANEAAITGDTNRTELVRRMWDAAGNVIPGSGEIVSEYAVDLSFAVWRVDNPTTTAMTLLDYPQVKGGQLTTPTPTPPQSLRGLRVRLSTRARAPDRAGGATAAEGADPNRTDPALPLRRFNVFDEASTTRMRFARVRNSFVEVTLQNLRNVRW